MLSPALVIASSFAYLLLLFAVAYWADRRAQAGRSVIANPWTSRFRARRMGRPPGPSPRSKPDCTARYVRPR